MKVDWLLKPTRNQTQTKYGPFVEEPTIRDVQLHMIKGKRETMKNNCWWLAPMLASLWGHRTDQSKMSKCCEPQGLWSSKQVISKSSDSSVFQHLLTSSNFLLSEYYQSWPQISWIWRIHSDFMWFMWLIYIWLINVMASYIFLQGLKHRLKCLLHSCQWTPHSGLDLGAS